MRPSPLAALAVMALLLSGCGSGASDESDQASPTSAPKAEWSDWIELDAPMAIMAATADYAVLSETAEPNLAVYDRSGKELWTLPEPQDFRPDLPSATIASNEESVFVVEEKALTAFDWSTGKKQWAVDFAEFGECVLPADVSLLTSRLTEAVGTGGTLVLNANAADGSYDQLPQSCFGEITSDFKDVDVLVGIDAKTGEKKWSQTDNLNHKQLDAGLSLDGRFVDRVVTNKLPIYLERTEIGTGEKKRARLMLDEWGYSFPDPVFMSDMGQDEFAIDLGGNGFVLTQVEKWTESFDDAKSFPPGDADPCEVDVSTSRSGIQYCLEAPNGEGDYRSKLVRGLGADGTPAPVTTPITDAPWTAAGPTNVPTDPETSGPGIFGIDPVAPRDGADPLIGLPGKDAPLQGFNLVSGKVEWTVPGEKGTYAEYTSYVPPTGEFVTSMGGEIVGIDATSGEETWREPAPFDGASPMSAQGPFVLVRSEDAGQSVLRTVEVAK